MLEAEALAQINQLVGTFFSAFDNRGGRAIDLSSLEACFVERGIVTRRTEADAQLFSLQEFLLPRQKLLSDGSLCEFHEWEVDSETKILGGIAMRHSNYRKYGVLNGSAYSGTGAKCFQFVLRNDGWRIVSMLWEDET